MRTLILTISALLLMTLSLNAQIELNFDPSIDPADLVCINVLNNSTRSFTVGATCDDAIHIVDATGTTVAEFTGVTSFTYTFTSPGEYQVLCNAPLPGGAAGASDPVVCINVVEPIPTMSEWGLMATILLLLIFGVNTIKQRKTVPALA